MFKQQIIVSSTVNNRELRDKAVCLAEKLQLPFKENIEPSENLLLLFYDLAGLSLCQFYGRRGRIHKVLFVDFVNGKNGYRLAHNCTIRQPLARAVGIKPGIRPTVIDATAGLGGDGFVLASLGIQCFHRQERPPPKNNQCSCCGSLQAMILISSGLSLRQRPAAQDVLP